MLRPLVRAMRGLPAAVVLAAVLVGLPWALIRYVGWPLPDRPPSWAAIHDVLLGPMTTTFLLDFLACLTWPAWATFVFDAARCAIAVARDARPPDPSATGPVHRIAAVLVGTLLICLLGQRGNQSFAVTSATRTGATEVVATAPARDEPNGVPRQPARAKSAVVLPYDPETGLHDSLWRMAHRTLGDGHRWPEIFELNEGKPRPGGGAFTRPSLIFPGEEMNLPGDATVPAAPPTRPAAPVPPPPPPSPVPAPADTQVPHTPAALPGSDTPGEPGIGWGAEVFVGLGLASAVGTALVVVRHRNRRRYLPGSGDRSDLPVAPVVYRLRLAHLNTDRDHPDDPEPGGHGTPPRHAPVPQLVLGTDSSSDGQVPVVLSVGARNGCEIALDLAAAHGLGLVGAGAAAAVRALLVTALATPPATTDAAAKVVVPTEDLALLLGRRAARTTSPSGLHVVADLDTALDLLEAETLVRVGQPPPTDRPRGPVVLVTRPHGRQARRLQAVLDNGASVGVTGLLLGQWTGGVSAYVRDDGTITATSPGPGEPLRGTRVFRLGDDHTMDLLTLLHHAEPDAPNLDLVTGTSPAVPVPAEETVRRADPEPSAGGRRRDERNLEILRATSTTTADGHPEGDAPRDPAGSPAEPRPLRITVLGPPRVWWRPQPTTPGRQVVEQEVTAAFPPRVRELLVFLALHPDGAGREALITALWGTGPPEKTTNAMNTGLTRLRRAVTTATGGELSDVVLVGESRYRLDPELVEVDYWTLAAAVTARRIATTDRDRVEAYRRIVDSYTGPLVDGMSAEWVETAREAVRRDAVDAVAALARALVGHDPQRTLDLLEVARSFDPHNELIYRDIMRLQERLGRLDAIPRTLALLTARLAEIDDRPTPQAVDLAERLRRRHDDCGAFEPGTGPDRSRT